MNKDLEKLIDDFYTYELKVEGKSEKSATFYSQHCREFIKEMNIKNMEDLTNAKSKTIIDWLQMLTDRNNSPATRKIKLISVKLLFNYLEFVKDYKVDKKIQQLKPPKQQQKEKKYLTEEQMQQMMNIAINTKMKAAMSILSTTGVRFSEMIQITCTDIQNGYATIIGKGNKKRTIWFTPNCQYLCNIFINNRRKGIIRELNLDTDLLFITNTGKTLGLHQFNEYLKKIARKAGISWYQDVSAHTFRHSFITKMIDKGTPISNVRDMVGHTNIAITNTYAHSNEEAIKNIMLHQDDLGE